MSVKLTIPLRHPLLMFGKEFTVIAWKQLEEQPAPVSVQASVRSTGAMDGLFPFSGCRDRGFEGKDCLQREHER